VAKGTGNDFLKIFGEGWREGFNDLEGLMNGPQAAFDVIDCGGKLGLGVACAGIDARVGNGVHRYKSLPLVGGMGAYVLSLIDNVICKGITQAMKVSCDDGYEYNGKVSLICGCNGRYYGGGFMPVGEAMPDDGILDFLIVRGVTLFQLVRLIKKYATGRYRECLQYIHHFRGQQVTFSAEDGMVVVVDGELVSGQEITIKLSEKKVNFFWPEYLDYHLTEKTLAQTQV
jgi:diacylglycerol kinase family enzyme